ncbi:hypothetical protein ACLB1N_00170 [Escherichia coli]
MQNPSIRNPHGKCLICAKRVVEILTQHRCYPYRVIGLLTWTGLSNLTPANHYAVVASLRGQAIIINPTAGQFWDGDRFMEKLTTGLQASANIYLTGL